MSHYAEVIRKSAAVVGVTVDPRHVEAWMRLEYGCLDALDAETFRRWAKIAAEQPVALSEALARSEGL